MSLLRNSIRKPVASQHQEGLQTNMEETVLDFQQETMKALWHAFHMLDSSNSGSVHVSQLKVITSTIGSKLGFDKAEEILNKDGVLSMDFATYFEIVKNELIDKQERIHSDEAFLGTRLNYVIKTCWTFCNFERQHHCKSFTSENCIVLWRLYNFLCETDDAGEPAIPVLLHPEEAGLLLREFIDVTGQKNKETQVKEFLTETQDTPLTFTDFLNAFEKDYVTVLSNKNITIGLNQLYDTYILNILMKGKIRKRGFQVKTWKDRWLVLTPTHLKYYVGQDEKVLKGTIQFDGDCTIEVPADRPTHKPNRFVIHTPKKPYEMSAFDLRSKNEWVSAVELALSRVGKDPNVQKEAARERCMARAEKRRLAAEEEKRRREDAELLRSRENELDEQKKKRLEDGELLRARLSELEEERKRREEAEARWQEEQTLRESEQQRLRELEEIKRELERLLAEERQAKKDEEIVRNLQSKLLEEEFEKREELERLKQQQEEMLKAEREQKAVLESDRKEQERLFAEAQARLEQLERDKAAAAEKMQEAAEKLQKAEKDRHIMEEKVKLWKTPVGLARPIQPHVDLLVTHRGYGAFCDKDFVRKQMSIDEKEGGSKVPDLNKVSDDPGTAIKADNVNDDSEAKNQNGNIPKVADNDETKTNQDSSNTDSIENETPETSNAHEVNADKEKEKRNMKPAVNEGENVKNTDFETSEANSVSDASGNDDRKVVKEETFEEKNNIQSDTRALNTTADSGELKPDISDAAKTVLDEEQHDEFEKITEVNDVNDEDLSLKNEQSDDIYSTDCKTITEVGKTEEQNPNDEQSDRVEAENNKNANAVIET